MQGGGELKVTSLFFAATFSGKMQVLDEALHGVPFCASSSPPFCSLFFLFSLWFLSLSRLCFFGHPFFLSIFVLFSSFLSYLL
jgi:hypothetical protein